MLEWVFGKNNITICWKRMPNYLKFKNKCLRKCVIYYWNIRPVDIKLILLVIIKKTPTCFINWKMSRICVNEQIFIFLEGKFRTVSVKKWTIYYIHELYIYMRSRYFLIFSYLLKCYVSYLFGKARFYFNYLSRLFWTPNSTSIGIPTIPSTTS